jgi:hypothetical protein
LNSKEDRQFKGKIESQLPAKVPGGEVLSLITGQESLEELRLLVVEFSQACPVKKTNLACPFHIMGTLSHASLATLANSLSRESCLALFKMELDCRSQSNSPCELPLPKRGLINGLQQAALIRQQQKHDEKPPGQTLRPQ